MSVIKGGDPENKISLMMKHTKSMVQQLFYQLKMNTSHWANMGLHNLSPLFKREQYFKDGETGRVVKCFAQSQRGSLWHSLDYNLASSLKLDSLTLLTSARACLHLLGDRRCRDRSPHVQFSGCSKDPLNWPLMTPCRLPLLLMTQQSTEVDGRVFPHWLPAVGTLQKLNLRNADSSYATHLAGVAYLRSAFSPGVNQTSMTFYEHHSDWAGG